MILGQRLDRGPHLRDLLRAEHAPLHDVAKLDVLELRHLEALGVVVKVLVDLALVDQVREEFLQVSLPRNEHEDGQGALTGGVIDDDVEVVDLADELLARFLGEPEQELVDEQHHAAEALCLGVRSHPVQALAPARVDAGVPCVAALVGEPGAREALAPLR
ncbi:MAG: hypothetical protein IPG04_41685 [Polyangiaceae bacterium]|nr:hypothetical protein [Polyangiaceae bacterium]